MPTHNYNITIRKALSRAVILITSLSIVLSVAISTYLDIELQKKNTIQELTTLAKIMAYNARATILFDDEEDQSKQLQAYQSVESIRNIHVYKVDQFSGSISHFSSFNERSTPPIASQVAKLSNDTKVIIRESTIEIIHPIKDQSINPLTQTVTNQDLEAEGYIYIRGSLEALEAHFTQRITIDFIVAICILAVVLLVTLTLQRRFTRPIEALSALVQDVSKNKNYSLKAPRVSITELDQLGNNLNALFARTLAQMERQSKNESEIRQLNQELEAKVNHRTLALKDANQELLSTLERMHQYQNKIVENEKMASLGQMVAGVAHEVNTPIGLGVTGSTLLKDKLEELKGQFDNKTLTSKQMERFIIEGMESLDLIYRNLNRAAELVSSFKQVAVNDDAELAKQTKLIELIKQIVKSKGGEIEATEHMVHIDGDQDLEITTKATQLQQVITQLINNSLIHAFKPEQQGNIYIQVKQNDDAIVIDYHDDGIGVSGEIRSRIFDPFVTTRRGEGGSGLGMHLVYNLVTQALNGSIRLLESNNEQGAFFRIELPKQGNQS